MIKFLVFADIHYFKGMYRTQVEDLDMVLKRAHDEGVDFVIHCGDFSNDHHGSPEFVNAYLNNKYNLPVYGVYGNHDLESPNDTMLSISPSLSNQEVNFGEAKLGEPTCGYWYKDIGNYRLVGLDTNYSYNPAFYACNWMHIEDGAPHKGNYAKDSLSPVQLDWFYDLVKSASEEGKKVIAASHAALHHLTFESSPDADHFHNICKKFPGTVLLVMNGHMHTDHAAVVDGTCYFDVNTASLGCWSMDDKLHYKDTDTFVRTNYDEKGNPIGTEEVPFNSLSEACETWSFKYPLSAVVTIDDNNKITIKGMETEWDCGLAPTKDTVKFMPEGCKPRIEDREFQL